MGTQHDGIDIEVPTDGGSEDGFRLEGALLLRADDRADDEYIAVGFAEGGVRSEGLTLYAPGGSICGEARVRYSEENGFGIELGLDERLQQSIDTQGGFRLLVNYSIDGEGRHTHALDVGVSGEAG